MLYGMTIDINKQCWIPSSPNQR